MAEFEAIPLDPIRIDLSSPIFCREICGWTFADTYVARLLRDDIPHRVKYQGLRMWAYSDADREIVGFGSIGVCSDYEVFTGNKPHPYIPLLAVNPRKQGRGYGRFIVGHLVGEAVRLARDPAAKCCDVLFLDVYASNRRAISLYEKNGFARISDDPFLDEIEGQPYLVMMRRVSIATS